VRFIKSNFEILDQAPGLDGIYKQIELAGRSCYKSEDRITEDSAEKFVNMIKDRQHTAMLEHGTVYLYIHKDHAYNVIGDNWVTEQYLSNSYSVINTDSYGNYHITTNYRVLYENGWLDDLKHLCEPTEYHEKRITVKFILPISISREFCRHRVLSFAEQSTRYCNYNSDKFNNELTFIIPYWTDLKEARYQYWDNDWVDAADKNNIPNTILKHFEGDSVDIFLSQCESAEVNYKALINRGCKAQEVREILPLCTKTELIMTGTIEQWRGFFKLRTDKAAHPQARELAIPLKEEFIKRNLLDGND
jgi:thymidylate synthase (FAD)